MQSWTVERSSLSGTIHVPASKSHSQRAILFASLGNGTSRIENLLVSPDLHKLIRSCETLGAKIIVEGSSASVKGARMEKASGRLDVGNSGIALRFLTAIASLSDQEIEITGDPRPMDALLKALRMLGVKTNNAFPIRVQGPFKGGKTVVDGRDSQPVSALLIAAPFADADTEIHVEKPGELPWIDLTCSWLDRLGIRYERDGYHYFKLFGRQSISPFQYRVPGDWSSAAFPRAAALVTGSNVEITDLDPNDCQGDKKLFSIFQQMNGSNLKVDLNDCIDALPVLSVVACFSKGQTEIRNALAARGKECDRISCVVKELRKMGADIEEFSDGVLVRPSILKGAEVESHSDHRMAMALAVAGMGANGSTRILGVECAEKTFPGFKEEFLKLGAKIR